MPETYQTLRIYLGDSEHRHGHRLSKQLIQRAHDFGLAGATMWRGFYGYGKHMRVHTSYIEVASQELPAVVEIVDRSDRLAAFLEQVADLKLSFATLSEAKLVPLEGLDGIS